MGTTSSSTANPTVAESEAPYMSTQSTRIIKSKIPEMAVAFDAQIHHQDDLGHDTLMGLQELDSQLAMFENSADPGKGSSTPNSLSDILSTNSYSAIDTSSSTHIDGLRSRGYLSNLENTASPDADTGRTMKTNGHLK